MTIAVIELETMQSESGMYAFERDSRTVSESKNDDITGGRIDCLNCLAMNATKIAKYPHSFEKSRVGP